MVEFLLAVIAVLLVVLIFRTNKLLEKNIGSKIALVRKEMMEATLDPTGHINKLENEVNYFRTRAVDRLNVLVSTAETGRPLDKQKDDRRSEAYYTVREIS
ncbi:hypothetical protein N9F34_01325 [Alphaproteobacteria bacterium]|nr:hypothetical protein [Alphaproteobacteria bacterium]